MTIEVLPVTQPADPPYLDHYFQNWMVDGRIDLMRRNPQAKKLLQEDLPRLRSLKTGEFTRQEQLLKFLLSQEGYLVSRARVAQVLYNGYVGPSEINDIKQVYHRLRDRLHYPKLLYGRAGIGIGVGIKDFSLRLGELQLLYPLWRKKRDWVRFHELGQEVFNSADSSIFGNALVSTICRLRRSLSRGGYARIETRRTVLIEEVPHEGAYRLVES